jgi:hypothetical protein
MRLHRSEMIHGLPSLLKQKTLRHQQRPSQESDIAFLGTRYLSGQSRKKVVLRLVSTERTGSRVRGIDIPPQAHCRRAHGAPRIFRWSLVITGCWSGL